MRLRNQELIEEFYTKMLPLFPNLTLEQVTNICYTQYLFLREHIEGGKLGEVRLKYLGSFQVYPGRAENYLYNLKERLKYHKIEPTVYKRLSTMIENYLKNIKDESTVEKCAD